MENKRKRNITIASVAIIILLVVAIGASFAYFLSQKETEEFTVQSGNLSIDFSTTSTISLTNTIPLSEDEYLTEGSINTFTVKNSTSSTVDAYARMDITDINISENLKNYDFKWALYEGDTKLTTGSFVTLKDGGNSINIANNLSFPRNGSAKTYKLYVWLEETAKDQSNLFNGTFSGKITVTGQSKKINTLASNILEDNSVITNSPNLSSSSTDKGLYVQKNHSKKSILGFPTYYYRGAVTNSYVSLDNELWRIVRINESGTIRIIKNESIGTSSYEGSTYGDYIDSPIKTVVDSWFDNLSYDIKNKVAIEGYFYEADGDIDIIGSSDLHPDRYGNENVFPSFNNYSEHLTTDNINLYSSHAGLLTASEAVYAGMFYNTSTNSYLNNSTIYWLMSPWQVDYNFAINNGTLVAFYDLDGSRNVRPVINLKADVTISGGTGTSSDPYVIE